MDHTQNPGLKSTQEILEWPQQGCFNSVLAEELKGNPALKCRVYSVTCLDAATIEQGEFQGEYRPP